jgi:ABC-type siderophore export system fused ATPase/permease subunit
MLTTGGSFVTPLVHMIVTLGYFTLVQKRELSASIIFSAVSGFNIIRWGLQAMIGVLPNLTQASVSIGRVEEFLNDASTLSIGFRVSLPERQG